jgi:hypothetical protein
METKGQHKDILVDQMAEGGGLGLKELRSFRVLNGFKGVVEWAKSMT